MQALHIGRDDALANLACPLGLALRRADAVGDRILVEGNSAAGLGAVYGGATVCAWYPITPSTSLAEAFDNYCARFRVDSATGKKRYAIVQAEDEIAAIGMVVGAGWNGARAFTATSGPGISLMQEFLGLAYFAEIPAVDLRRAARRPVDRHADAHAAIGLLSCAYASHGDTKHVLLFPEDPDEAFEFGALAFDLADRLQTPIFVMLDLDIGMNASSLRAVRLGRCAQLRPRQGDDRGRPRGGPRFRPLSRRRRRRHSLSHLSRHASDARRLLHPRHQPRPLRPLHRGRRPLRRQHGAAAAQVRHRQARSCRAPICARPRSRPASA